ncbi:MCE family protein [Nocardioides sp. NPDC057767]|jgi:phospholipid/cholesterol/gamma-HCH transport system substrate-binding protein|uniref:Phospholipid/cholesterol/gamma-HCH transport system substrate-binding protein n=1 Tax=Nocardioides albertanoniae TaxID=1175486 RepID=A0A543ACT7_9ACTN|nr:MULTISPECIES: MCE family protein [Nocardioides]EGD41029.1 virulence factor Mce family protein [Nocardioidaceae bacterium Broad-1]MBC7277377.1 MCE family protein [Nocardioides sp.]TQL70399.1 phospholipid/cholesterol/gamma-HCH transport system substrate-binding protein [Nocardioides albertanoniae]
MSVRTPSQNAARGLIGTMAIALVVTASLNYNKLPLVGNGDIIHAAFTEAGGLKGGDAVMVSGAQVGKVRDVRLDGDEVVADLVVTEGDVDLGGKTEARIITVTLLGRAAVELVPSGSGRLSAGDTIPTSRTSSPYNLTATLNELTTTTADIDKAQLAGALDQASAALSGTHDDVGPALRGVTELTAAVEQNDDQLRALLARASRVSGVLASRNEQIETLLVSGQSLLQQLNARQAVVVSLLSSVQDLSTQLRGLVDDNRATLGPALDQLDAVVTLLNRNKAALQDAITGLRGYVTGFGEAISTGPWFDAYIQNLTSPGTLVPIVSGVVK